MKFTSPVIQKVSTFDVIVEEFEDVRLPLRDAQVQEIVSFVCRVTDRRVNLQDVGFLQAL